MPGEVIMTKERLVELKQKAMESRYHWEASCTGNYQGTAQQKVEWDVQYSIALAMYEKCKQQYNEAMEQYVKENT